MLNKPKIRFRIFSVALLAILNLTSGQDCGLELGTRCLNKTVYLHEYTYRRFADTKENMFLKNSCNYKAFAKEGRLYAET